jgi:LytS/YehU family sensor histidine kinase
MSGDVIAALIFAGIVTLVSLGLYYKAKEDMGRVIRRNAEISAKNTSLEMHKLKYALQPHTLNNILANLKAMSNQISRSMDSLSELLEYIFYHGEEHLVSVRDEVQFIKGYVQLQDVFTSDIDSIKLDLNHLDTNSKMYSERCIPHLITAYLIENAFKHGDINHPEFLTISLALSDNNFSIVVTNKTRKNYASQKTGIGLSNMQHRLKILKEGMYSFETNKQEDQFTASLTIKL